MYQSTHTPVITFYTYFHGGTEQQEFTANLPVPDRNYLYDLDVRIFEDTDSNTRSFSSGNKKGYRWEYNVCVYDEKGVLVDELTLSQER